jgi:D-alanine-D-alanine ligase
MNKKKTNQFLKEQRFDVPDNVFVTHEDWKDAATECCTKIRSQLNFPMIAKPHNDGCSVFVHKVHHENELYTVIKEIFASGKEAILIEEYVHGMELTVGVVGNDNPRVLPPSHTVAASGILSIEEKFLPGCGENRTPAPLAEASCYFVQKTIAAVYRAVECKGYARIDCFYQDAAVSPTGSERLVILEINSLPALTPATCLFHQAAEVGIKAMDFITYLITLGFEQHKIVHFPGELSTDSVSYDK